MYPNVEHDLYFGRNDKDTWAMARLHHSLLLQIQNWPLWEKEDIPDIPLSEEQMVTFVKGYTPSWDYPYVPYMLGGWFYITRSGWWIKKIKYQRGLDGFYHVTEHYSTPKSKGTNLLALVLQEGNFEDPIHDDHLDSILHKIVVFP